MQLLETHLQASSLNWIGIHPLQLTNGLRTGVYRVSVDGIPPKGKKISRADVADFMLKQLTSTQYIHRMPALAY